MVYAFSNIYLYIKNLIYLQLLGMPKIILLGFCNMGGMKKLWQLWKPVKGGVNSLKRYFQFVFVQLHSVPYHLT